MAVSERLKAFLQGSNVKFTAAKHPTVYTAQEIAASQHVPGRQLAKCVLVNTNDGPVLAVLPAIYLVDLKKLKGVLGAKTATIGKEADIKQRFPDIEVGAMSPFGNLYQVAVIVDQSLSASDQIVFNAGSHTDTIKMSYRDFAGLVRPKSGAFSQPRKGEAPRAPRKPSRKGTKKPAKKTRPAAKKKKRSSRRR
jgi:Ala-tRNA(Pro) deacylase